MKREILFRGKRTDNGEWVYGGYAEWGNVQHVIITKGEYGKNNSYEVDPETVGQYTGLLDCKGNKIFEGDIILVHNDLYDYGLPVVFKCGAFWLYDNFAINPDYPDDENAGLDLLGSYDKNFLEVVGNIHDNP